ncbi:UvrD-helicase domain-containing protein, partial [Oleiphilus sp. HI0132]
LHAPAEGNVYLLLWVDHHDRAYNWAAVHQCKINPNTGSLQIYETMIETMQKVSAPSTFEKGLFDNLKDKHLLRLGVPDELISSVRSVTNESMLDQLQHRLPKEAYEALFFYNAGESYESLLLESETSDVSSVDSSDYQQALSLPSTIASFFVPASEKELREMLAEPVAKWRVFLHPAQRKLVMGIKNGSVRVLGGAGTGKTVVAMHRAKWLAENCCDNGQKVLFTTYTKNLAIDISTSLQSICDQHTLSKIEVINLDQWVQNFLKHHNYGYRILYDQRKSEELWGKALIKCPRHLNFSNNFYKEEWQRVVQAQGIDTFNAYKRASRKGRGTRLDREQRFEIWPVFEEYRRLLNAEHYKEVDDVYRDTLGFIESGQGTQDYSSVIVDEAQDMGSQAYKLLRAIVPERPNDLFIVGDAHQRIYGKNKVILSQCGINIRGRSSKLKINYRTTDEIRLSAINLLEGRDIDDLDGGTDDNHQYKSLSHGEFPVIETLSNLNEQCSYVSNLVKQSAEPHENFCVVARTNSEVNELSKGFANLGIKTSIIQANRADEGSGAIKLATVHRVKGLEFNHVVLASANEGLIPLQYALQGRADKASLAQADTEERSLVYVALTRARKSAHILSYGQLSSYFNEQRLL